MNLKLFLEHLLSEQAVDEAAVGVAQARTEQLAIAIVPGNKGGKVVILYKPNEILQEADRSLAEVNDDQIEVEDIINSKSIVGSISCHKYSKDIYEVQLAGANSGYGPLVYDLALSTLYPNFLISDRRSVSKSAEKVWKFYLNNRTDVEKQPFRPSYNIETQDVSSDALSADLLRKIDNLRYLINKSKEAINNRFSGADKQRAKEELRRLQMKYDNLKAKRDEKLAKNPLSYMYRIKKPKSFASLTNNHNKLMTQLDSRIPKFHPGKFLEVIARMAEDWATMRIS